MLLLPSLEQARAAGRGADAALARRSTAGTLQVACPYVVLAVDSCLHLCSH